MHKITQLFLDEYQPSETNFISALIAHLLRDSKDYRLQKIIRDIKDSLKIQQKQPLQWNYNTGTQKYPDDLDDTFSALLALDIYTPEVMNLLTRQQDSSGGYETWTHKDWHDIDIVVNSTISYYLGLHKIFLPKLTNYIDTLNITSKYYKNPIVILYFISRGYRGKRKQELITKIKSHTCTSLLETSLSLSALMNLDQPIDISCLSLQLPLHNELYIEKGDQYAGSNALTYAFCIETLHLYQKTKILHELCDPALAIHPRFQNIYTTGKKHNQIISLGWTSYSLLDEVADGDMPLTTLYDVSFMQYELFSEINKKIDDKIFIKKILRKMHTACIWELQHCRDITRLPRFRKYRHHSGYKSYGYVLGLNNHSPSHLKFYREYLELKQLNDDAYDWKEDFEKGHITHANIGIARYHNRGGKDFSIFFKKIVQPKILLRFRMHIRRMKKLAGEDEELMSIIYPYERILEGSTYRS